MTDRGAGIVLRPDAPPEALAALRLALETFAAEARGHVAMHLAGGWRRAALTEGVDRAPADASRDYASPRSRRGATRA